ncbi:MAG: glycoside hydrolase family 127 protein, partial [Lentisphaerales bacterium]|nr:glycoside hydrolase family 127 protein [Lentisphaerales bacterium]
VTYNNVFLNDSFWLPRLKTQKKRTLPFAIEKTERAVENLSRCANFLKGIEDEKPFTHRFVTSDLYKVMEGAASLLMTNRDEKLEEQMDEIIEIIANAQQDDGYLYVNHITGTFNVGEMGEKPYSHVIHSHELYNVGHMYEGAVAYYQATGKDAWLKVAEKSAQHVHRVFVEGDPNYNDGKPINQAPGHQEIEIGLCKLYAVTGNTLYLDLAKHLLEIRGVTFRPDGEGVNAADYAQQHAPVAEQDTAEGHAVRAGYMYASMAEVDALRGENDYTSALNKIWHNLVDRKMHITGGLGAIHGIEGFGDDFDLPNKEAYNETCAAIANVFFNYRMFLLHRDATYFDVAEVALLNNSLAGVNMEGDKFFYVNPLESDGQRLFNHGNAGRSHWFDCACCPSNIARIMPQVSGYMYASEEDEIFTLLYAGSKVELDMPEGKVKLDQQTEYPFEGKVKFSVGLEEAQQFAIKLRIPSWAREQFLPGSLYKYTQKPQQKWTVKINGTNIVTNIEKGFVEIRRTWNDGDVLELDLPMDVHFSTCDTRVEANIGRLAPTRGPLVLCAEEIDNEGPVQRFYLENNIPQGVSVSQLSDDLLSGVPVVSVTAQQLDGGDETMKLIPYYAWNNRGNGSMNVWFPTQPTQAKKSLDAIAFDNAKYGTVSASFCAVGDSVEALYDGRRPQSACDQSISKWSSAGQAGETQTIEMKFNESQKVESLGVYWYEEEGTEIATPESWNMEFLKDGEWQPFERYVTDFFGTDINMYVVVHPAASLFCDGLRLTIVPQEGKAIGLLDLDLMND